MVSFVLYREENGVAHGVGSAEVVHSTRAGASTFLLASVPVAHTGLDNIGPTVLHLTYRTTLTFYTSGTTCSGGAPSQLSSTYIHHLLATGSLQTHIQQTLLPAYTSRYHTLMSAISTHLLPLGFQLPQSSRSVVGGYFTWLGLPEGLKAEPLAQRCREEENVVIAAGKIFEVPGDEGERSKFERHVRFCWAWEEEWKLEEGVKRVGKVAERMLEEGEGAGEGFVVVEKEGGDGLGEFK